MIEILIIKDNNVKKVATITDISTWYQHCNEIVEAIAKTIYCY